MMSILAAIIIDISKPMKCVHNHDRETHLQVDFSNPYFYRLCFMFVDTRFRQNCSDFHQIW